VHLHWAELVFTQSRAITKRPFPPSSSTASAFSQEIPDEDGPAPASEPEIEDEACGSRGLVALLELGDEGRVAAATEGVYDRACKAELSLHPGV
jgi:hypothetical protein